MNNKIIFYYPILLNNNSKVASGIRPVKMLQAFLQLGYDVDIVSGFSHERREKIKDVIKKINSGAKYDFLYGESINDTMISTGRPNYDMWLQPNTDWKFFKFLKLHSIPMGIFYRDIYWKFDEYINRKGFFIGNLKKILFSYELLQFKKYISKLYLPSLEMGKYIPFIPENMFEALPPGHDYNSNLENTTSLDDGIKILYIGGLSSHYKMHVLFKVLSRFPTIEFTLCTRKEEWEATRNEYMEYLKPNIKIVHKHGNELEELYSNCNISSIFVVPQKYWSFAAPVKLYEYIGRQKPIIATQGTLAGEIVEKKNIGWNIDYSEESLTNLFSKLLSQKEDYTEKLENISKFSKSNTWLARANQVCVSLKAMRIRK